VAEGLGCGLHPAGSRSVRDHRGSEGRQGSAGRGALASRWHSQAFESMERAGNRLPRRQESRGEIGIRAGHPDREGRAAGDRACRTNHRSSKDVVMLRRITVVIDSKLLKAVYRAANRNKLTSPALIRNNVRERVDGPTAPRLEQVTSDTISINET